MNKKTNQSAFTLIELLVVIAIIAVLATVVFVALNPAGRLADARDARRTNDVQNYITAIHECIIDQAGSITACGLSTSMVARQFGSAVAGCENNGAACGTNVACLNLSTQLAPYLASLPVDPSLASASTETHYGISVNGNNIVTITACDAEGGTISVSR